MDWLIGQSKSERYHQHVSVSREVVDRLLQLPERDRVDIARRLQDSIGPETSADDDLWLEDIVARVERVRTGQSQGLPAEDVFAEAEERLKK